MIEKGKEEGATLAFGGDKVGDEGYYIQPTVFANVTDEMTIAREEVRYFRLLTLQAWFPLRVFFYKNKVYKNIKLQWQN